MKIRIVGLLVSLVSLAGMGLRFGLVLDRQGVQALKHCTVGARLTRPAATKAARCVGTTVVAIWRRKAGELTSRSVTEAATVRIGSTPRGKP